MRGVDCRISVNDRQARIVNADRERGLWCDLTQHGDELRPFPMPWKLRQR